MDILSFIIDAMANGFDGVIPAEVMQFMESIDFNLDNLFGTDYPAESQHSYSVEGGTAGNADSSTIKNG